MYSTIKKKKCKCSNNCEKLPTISCEGYFYAHLPEILKEKIGDKKKLQIKNRNKRATLSSKIRKAQRDVSVENKIELYFMLAATELSKHPYCENCGVFIPKEYYRASTAHIFPKSIFKSVSSHPMNRLFLGAHCGCHNLTHRLDTFSKMNIWYKAAERFLHFKDMITENHKYLDMFLGYVKDEDNAPHKAIPNQLKE